MTKTKLTFSGHETFHCRHFWLKKGYDFIINNYRFSDPDSVVKLGVGKNMVSSIRFWMHSFGLVDSDEELTPLAHHIFGPEGFDPYLENIGTIWLLHYHLVKAQKASIYFLFFNEFRRGRTEFNKGQLEKFIEGKCKEFGNTTSPNSIAKDVGVFLKNYVRPKNQTRNIEDEFSSIFIDLELIQEIGVLESAGSTWYRINFSEQESLADDLVLYSILDQYDELNRQSIPFSNLMTDDKNPGKVFMLSANGLVHKIESLENKDPGIVFKEDAGRKELQLKPEFDKWEILRKYYAN